MKKSKFTEEQFAFSLKQAESGTTVEEICRKMGTSQATFYAWRKKFGGLGVAELRRLRQLEEENRKLKQLVADLSLDKVMLQDVLSKSSKARAAQDACVPFARPLPRRRAPGLRGGQAEPLGMLLPPGRTMMRHGFGGSRRLPPHGCAMASAGSSCCCGGKAGRPTTSAYTGCTVRPGSTCDASGHAGTRPRRIA